MNVSNLNGTAHSAPIHEVPNIAAVSPHRAGLEALRGSLQARFFERRDVIDGLLIGLLAREHVLLLGPPGTAKSALISALTASIEGATPFSWLMTKFTTPEELFGPISLVGLQQDHVRRIVTGKLPEAHIGFIDECYKASSAILNSLLTIVNERVYHAEAGKPMKVPLETLVGASNEFPESEELAAMHDRFLLRFWIDPLREDKSRAAMYRGKLARRAQGSPPIVPCITLDELHTAQEEVAQIPIDDAALETYLEIRRELEEEKFVLSDRRWEAALSALQAQAYLAGDDTVRIDHFMILKSILWSRPPEREKIIEIIGARAAPQATEALTLLDAAAQQMSQLPAALKPGSSPTEQMAYTTKLHEANAKIDSVLSDLNSLKAKAGMSSVTTVADSIRRVEEYKQQITERVARTFNFGKRT